MCSQLSKVSEFEYGCLAAWVLSLLVFLLEEVCVCARARMLAHAWHLLCVQRCSLPTLGNSHG